MTNVAEMLSSQSDYVLERMLQTWAGQLDVRDERGNLRALSDAEVAFGQALRAEAWRRGLR